MDKYKKKNQVYTTLFLWHRIFQSCDRWIFCLLKISCWKLMRYVQVIWSEVYCSGESNVFLYFGTYLFMLPISRDQSISSCDVQPLIADTVTVGALTRCALLHSVCGLEVVQMNAYRCLIRKIMPLLRKRWKGNKSLFGNQTVEVISLG